VGSRSQGLFTGNITLMVNNWETSERWAAPGELELMRRFLNTWQLQTQTRRWEDRLPQLIARPGAWKSLFAQIPPPRRDELRELVELRAALRKVIEEDFDAELLTHWLRRARLAPTVSYDPEEGTAIRLVAIKGGATARFLAVAAQAVADGTWHRLKACPDCGLVFFDRSRNQAKQWCGMYAGEEGRACGSIAKVRNWRRRHSRSVNATKR
jgi:predicted RNA-binding Zn ribbon-like protein